MTNPLAPPGPDDLRVCLAAHDDPQYLHAHERDGRPLLHAVLLNVSAGPLKLWAEDCSHGNSNLTLEVLALDGRELPAPAVVRRGPSLWRQNRVRLVTLGPGEVAVRPVRLHAYTEGQREAPVVWTDHIHYAGFPSLGHASIGHPIRLRAVFTSGGGARAVAEGLWAGRAVSEERAYTVWDAYP